MAPYDRALAWQQFARQARELAIVIRPLEMASPGFFGEAGDIIRRQAAGDNVPPEELTRALSSMRLTLFAFQAGRAAAIEADGRFGAEDAWELTKACLFRKAGVPPNWSWGGEEDDTGDA